MKSWYLIAAMAFGVSATAGEVELRMLLPLDRTAYQTNESIPVAVLRSSAQALAASELAVALAGDDGSRMAFSWPLDAVPVAGNDARATEHLYLNARLLRPGRYSLEATANGATASAAIEVFGHVRKSSFKLIAWGSEASPAEQELMGEDGLGFNLLLARGIGDHSIRGAVDWMQCCTQGGRVQSGPAERMRLVGPLRDPGRVGEERRSCTGARRTPWASISTTRRC